MTRKKSGKKLPELELALKLSDAVEIKDITLIENHCRLFGISKKQNQYEICCSTDYDLEEKGKILLTRVRFRLKAKNAEEADIALMEAAYVVVYYLKTDKQFSSDHFINFSDYCSVFHVWPYWREFVQRATADFRLPTLTLPVYKFGMKLPKSELLIQKKILKHPDMDKSRI